MDEETENLVLRMAKENPSCYDRIGPGQSWTKAVRPDRG
jgi:hypothetical protein